MRNPWSLTWKDTAEVAARLGARFGLTPSDRRAVRVETPEPVYDDLLSG